MLADFWPRPCFKPPKRPSLVCGRLTWKLETGNLATTIQYSTRQTLRPYSALQLLGYYRRGLRFRRFSPTHRTLLPGACARRRAGASPQDPLQANACNSSLHPDLSSVASSSCASSSITARASRCYTPSLVHTPTVSHLCLSSFHRPQGRRLPLAKHWAPAQPLFCCLTCPEAARRTYIHVHAQGSNHSDLGAVVLVTSYASLRSRCHFEPTHFISLLHSLLSILSYPHPSINYPSLNPLQNHSLHRLHTTSLAPSPDHPHYNSRSDYRL